MQDASLPTVQLTSDTNWDDIDAVFCCLPHGTTQEICASLPPHIKVRTGRFMCSVGT